MASRLALLLLFPLLSLTLCSCQPGGDRVKKDMEKKSWCSLNDYQMVGEPKEDKAGYVHYKFTGSVQCKDPHSLYSRKFPERTRIVGEAEFLGSWFGLRYEMTRYVFKADEAKSDGDKGDD